MLSKILMKPLSLVLLSLFLSLGLHLIAGEKPLPADDLVCLWDFDEEPGSDRVSTGQQKYQLEEMNGPIKRTEGRAEGENAVRIKSGQYFRIVDGGFKAIDFHGPDAQFTVTAWVRRHSKARWQAVAGIWNESEKKRQYCLFMNASTRSDSRTMTRLPTRDEVHGHVSDVGGPTEGKPFCITYSSSVATVPLKEWVFVAMTFDGKASRAYVNGKFVAEEGFNPYPLKGGLFNGNAEFTVGAVNRSGVMGNFLDGELDELAIYSRALTEEELLELAKQGQEMEK